MYTRDIPKLSSVPLALAQYPQFILCKLDGTRKVPCNAAGKPIDPLDPKNWLTSTQALEQHLNGRFGVGFVLTKDAGFFCVDLDKAWDVVTRLWSPLALSTYARFPGAYVEVSLSGTGMHIFGRATVSPHGTRAEGIELYSHSRYIWLTGTGARGEAGLDFTQALATLIRDHGLGEAPKAQSVAPVVDGPALGYTGPADDAECVRAMLASPGSTKILMGEAPHPRDLWTGNVEALTRFYPQPGRDDGCPYNRSAADFALMNHLRYWTGAHASRMCTLFAQSALWRDEKYAGKGNYRLDYMLDKTIGEGGKIYDLVRSGPISDVKAALQLPLAPDALPNIIHAPDMLASPAEPWEWTVKGLIPHKQVTLLGGDGGVGKTTLLIMLGLAASCMHPWLGMLAMPRKVLFVSAEDEYRDVKRLVEQVAKAMGVDASNFYVMTLESMASPELASMVSGVFTATQLFHHITAKIKEMSFTMVMLDPAADLFGGNEIDRQQVRSFIRLLRGWDITTVLSAHPSVDAMKTARGYSGSTAWNNSVRSRLYFTVDEKDNDLRKLQLMKSNRSRAGQIIKMRWSDGIFVIEDEAIENENSETIFMKILRKRTSAGIFHSPNKSNNYLPVAFESDDDAHGIKRKAFETVMIKLLNEGKLEISITGSKSKERERIVERLSN